MLKLMGKKLFTILHSNICLCMNATNFNIGICADSPESSLLNDVITVKPV